MLLQLGQRKSVYLPTADRLSLNKSREVRILSRYLKPGPGEKILDVACGSGYWTAKLASRFGCEVTGVDISREAISVASSHHTSSRCTYAVCPAESLPFPSESFDKIISVCALEHFNSDTQAISEMHRVLKNDGVLAITVDSFSPPFVSAAYRQWHRQKFSVNNFYSISTIREKLEAANFQVDEHQYLLTSRLTFRLFRILWRFRKPLALSIPLVYPVSRLSDFVAGSRQWGLILALRATKNGAKKRMRS